MDLQEKTREELMAMAKRLDLKVTKNISVDALRTKVEYAAIERHEKMAAEVREKVRSAAALRLRIAEVEASAKVAKVSITLPPEPTLMDVIEAEKELGIKKKMPKPSPETVAIEASKKVYALYRNLEQEDVDVVASVGGKYTFHFWPEKVHVLPEWLIQQYRSAKNPAGTRPHSEKTEIRDGDKVVMRMSKPTRKARFTFEILGDAPKDAEFGIVTDEDILSKLEQHI